MRQAAGVLVTEGYALEEDVDVMVEQGGQRYGLLRAGSSRWQPQRLDPAELPRKGRGRPVSFPLPFRGSLVSRSRGSAARGTPSYARCIRSAWASGPRPSPC